MNEQVVNTPRLEDGRWAPGVSANPLGRPKGSKNKLSEDFLSALSVDFAEHGASAIRACREESPSNYVKVIASILPKELIVERATDGLTDAQLAAALEFVRSVLMGSNGQGDRGGIEIEGVAEQVSELQSISKTA